MATATTDGAYEPIAREHLDPEAPAFDSFGNVAALLSEYRELPHTVRDLRRLLRRCEGLTDEDLRRRMQRRLQAPSPAHANPRGHAGGRDAPRVLSYDGTKGFLIPNANDITRQIEAAEDRLEQVEGALRRLGLSYVNLHAAGPRPPFWIVRDGDAGLPVFAPPPAGVSADLVDVIRDCLAARRPGMYGSLSDHVKAVRPDLRGELEKLLPKGAGVAAVTEPPGADDDEDLEDGDLGDDVGD